MIEQFKLEFLSNSLNESFARTVVAAYITRLNPTIGEISDVKTAVSEAVTNAIIHGYPKGAGPVCLSCGIDGDEVVVEVEDKGVGIEDIEQALVPMYTTRPELERSGMGFSFMEAFMDSLEIISKPQQGTLIRMKKKIGGT